LTERCLGGADSCDDSFEGEEKFVRKEAGNNAENIIRCCVDVRRCVRLTIKEVFMMIVLS